MGKEVPVKYNGEVIGTGWVDDSGMAMMTVFGGIKDLLDVTPSQESIQLAPKTKES